MDIVGAIQQSLGKPGIEIMCPNCRVVRVHSYLIEGLPEGTGVLACQTCMWAREEGTELVALRRQQAEDKVAKVAKTAAKAKAEATA